MFAAQADGRSIETVESLGRIGQMNASQESFHEHHALQCGFCTPGMLMTATDLLRNIRSPPTTTSAKAFQQSLPLHRLRAHRQGDPRRRRQRAPMNDAPEIHARPKIIGARIKRSEDPRLLTGLGAYTDDRQVMRVLHVAFRRSDQSHARIRATDCAAARTAPGIVAVFTAEDLSDTVKPLVATSRMANTTPRRSCRWRAARCAMSASRGRRRCRQPLPRRRCA